MLGLYQLLSFLFPVLNQPFDFFWIQLRSIMSSRILPCRINLPARNMRRWNCKSQWIMRRWKSSKPWWVLPVPSWNILQLFRYSFDLSRSDGFYNNLRFFRSEYYCLQWGYLIFQNKSCLLELWGCWFQFDVCLSKLFKSRVSEPLYLLWRCGRVCVQV